MSKQHPKKIKPPVYDKEAGTIRVNGQKHGLDGMPPGLMFNLLRTKQVPKQAFFHWLYLEVESEMASYGEASSVLTKFHNLEKGEPYGGV